MLGWKCADGMIVVDECDAGPWGKCMRIGLVSESGEDDGAQLIRIPHGLPALDCFARIAAAMVRLDDGIYQQVMRTRGKS